MRLAGASWHVSRIGFVVRDDHRLLHLRSLGHMLLSLITLIYSIKPILRIFQVVIAAGTAQ